MPDVAQLATRIRPILMGVEEGKTSRGEQKTHNDDHHVPWRSQGTLLHHTENHRSDDARQTTPTSRPSVGEEVMG